MGAPPTRPGISPLKPHGSLDSNAGPVSPTSMTNPSTQSSLQTSSFSVSTGSSSSFIHIAKRNLAMHSQSGDSHSFSSKGVRRTASDRASPPDPELSVHSKSADLPLGKRQKAGQPERNLFGSLHVSGVKVPGPDGQLGIWFLFTVSHCHFEYVQVSDLPPPGPHRSSGRNVHFAISCFRLDRGRSDQQRPITAYGRGHLSTAQGLFPSKVSNHFSSLSLQLPRFVCLE